MISQAKTELFVAESTLPHSISPIYLSASKYNNNLILVINQTGTIGSILEAELQAQGQQDPIYQITSKFGATGSEFYQIVFRRILDTVYIDRKMGKQTRTTLIISLPLKNKQFVEKEYYDLLYEGMQKHISEVV